MSRLVSSLTVQRDCCGEKNAEKKAQEASEDQAVTSF